MTLVAKNGLDKLKSVPFMFVIALASFVLSFAAILAAIDSGSLILYFVSFSLAYIGLKRVWLIIVNLTK
jgi:hypothetical protein